MADANTLPSASNSDAGSAVGAGVGVGVGVGASRRKRPQQAQQAQQAQQVRQAQRPQRALASADPLSLLRERKPQSRQMEGPQAAPCTEKTIRDGLL